MNDRTSSTIDQRYARAADWTPPRIASHTTGLAADGYWINARFFYFLAEKEDRALDRVIAVPSIVDVVSGAVEEAVPFSRLAAAISEYRGEPVDIGELVEAEFDMPAPDILAVTFEGIDYLVDRQEARIETASPTLECAAIYSPNRSGACFVKNYDLWLRDLGSGQIRPLTSGGSPHIAHGREPDACLAAISYARRPRPMALWTADSEWVITHRIDERAVPAIPLVEHVPGAGQRPQLHSYRAPNPDTPIPTATFVAVHVASGRTVTFDDWPMPIMTSSPFAPMRRMAWLGGPRSFWFLRLDRYFKHAELVELDLETGAGRVVVMEDAPTGYLDFHHVLGAMPNVRTVSETGDIIWFSERDGWGHLYRYDAATGALRNRITEGDWMVRDIIHIDVARKRLLFTACGLEPVEDPARRTLCGIDFDGGGFEVLTAHDGDIVVPRSEPCGIGQDRPYRPYGAQPGVSSDGRFAAVRETHVERGNITRIISISNGSGFAIAEARPAPNEPLARRFHALAADGVTRLYGVMFLPGDFDEAGRYPLVDFIYPGPQVPHQPQAHRTVGAGPARALAELGFVTIMLDTRGIPFRSRALRQCGYGHLLEPQLADHAAVIQQLCAEHAFLDAGRIGIFGQSAGGAAAARALFDYGDLFKVGVAVCGSHDASLAGATWSDKFRGPRDETWSGQDNRSAAHRLRGKLLLVSGDLDENVPLFQTLGVADALVRSGRDFDLLILPNEGHHLLMTSGYAQKRIWDYFLRHLRDEAPPENLEIRFAADELRTMERHWIRDIFQ